MLWRGWLRGEAGADEEVMEGVETRVTRRVLSRRGGGGVETWWQLDVTQMRSACTNLVTLELEVRPQRPGFRSWLAPTCTFR